LFVINFANVCTHPRMREKKRLRKRRQSRKRRKRKQRKKRRVKRRSRMSPYYLLKDNVDKIGVHFL